MDEQLQERYRVETRRLIARRGPLAAGVFGLGVGLAGILEYHYDPERLPYLLTFFGLELAICLATIGGYRSRRWRRFGVALTRTAAVALVLCVTLYATFAGLNSTALALLVIVFELSVALMLPWGVFSQALMALVCIVAYGGAIVLGGVGADATLPLAYSVYAVAAGGLLSVLGAAFLDRQRFTVFAQRDQLDQHLATFRDLTRTFHGFDPARVVVLTCMSTLQTFRLRRLWVIWRMPGGGAIHGYFARSDRTGVTWQALADAQPFWTWVTDWEDPPHPFVARSDDPHAPAGLRGARASSMLCIPLGPQAERVAAICADRDGEPVALTERELALASVLASGAAIALTNAWLYQQVLAASEEKSVFLARIAHELRNPLQAILWDVDTLREQAAVPSTQLERLRQDALMTVDLARELQEFAEVETKRLSANPEPVNVEQTLDNLRATAMASLEGRSIAFVTRVGDGAGVLVTDPFRLRQILGNLISNAAKFTAHGAIEIEARRVGSDIAISVRDSGLGIPEAELARIFRPFYRGSARPFTPTRGMGLGLAIAQETATLLGGRVEVESMPGRGSTFLLVLPAGTPVETTASVPPPPEPGDATPLGVRVLIVEDDPSCRAQAADVLRQRGATVIEASTGREGLRQVREHRPDLILLDLGLPELSGLEVLAHLGRDPDLAGIPVVVATGDTDALLEARCRAAGCAAYLVKPYSARELLHAMEPLARRARAHGVAQVSPLAVGAHASSAVKQSSPI